MTISSQHDCAFEGYHEWSNGEIGGRERADDDQQRFGGEFLKDTDASS